MKILFKIIVIILGIYIALCIFLYFWQINIVFIPNNNYSIIPKDLNIKDIYITWNQNVKIHSWWMDNHSNKTILFFHWNAGNLSRTIQYFYFWKQLWVNVFAIDYRWFWQSNWRILKDQDLYDDWILAYNYLINQLKINEKDIIIRWFSLWWTVAIYTAQNKDIHWLILESVFFDLNNEAKMNYWFLPYKLLLKYKFPSNEYIKNVKCQKIFFHSKNDKVVSYNNWEMLFELASQPKKFIETKWAHEYAISRNFKLYYDALKEFIK